jgi:sulfhydrogenase subunit alpha
MARYNLNGHKLSSMAQEAAREAGLGAEVRNPFKSIIIRSVELVQACDEALQIMENYSKPEQAAVPVGAVEKDAPGVVRRGYACTEAPRGILYHRYGVDHEEKITDAKIVPPTSQNQKAIEEDLKEFVSERWEMPDDELTWQCEQAVRNYDPCISCATHYLKLKVERS